MWCKCKKGLLVVLRRVAPREFNIAVFLCRGCGFVQFPDERLQKRALEECQGAVGLGGKPLRLSLAANKWVFSESHLPLSARCCICARSTAPRTGSVHECFCAFLSKLKEQAAAAVGAQIMAVHLWIQTKLWPVHPVPAADLSWLLFFLGLWPDWRNVWLQLSAVWLLTVFCCTGNCCLC